MQNEHNDVPLNPDTIFTPGQGFQVEDYDAADIATARATAAEMMEAQGASINVYVRTNNADIDEVFEEDADPTYENPVPLKAFFTPQPLQQELTLWGVDRPNKVEIVLLRDSVIRHWPNRTLRPGDILEIPYNSVVQSAPKYFQVDNAFDSGNYRFVWLYLSCQCTAMTGEVNLRPHTDNAR